MKVLITGANGLVGSHFVENYQSDDINNFKLIYPEKKELDITSPNSVESFFNLYKPDVIIHFAAFTDVSLAEKQQNNKQGSCWIVNVEGTANLIRAAGKKPYFIYISTDVVFSGSKDNPGPYEEGHSTEENPNLLSWYGWTKREAEKLITKNLENFSILRIANPVRAKYNGKLDYVRKILRLFDTSKLYPMFVDQYLTLTYINEVTKTLKILLERRLPGIYHVSSTNLFTPHKLANYLLEKARGAKAAVEAISIEEFLKVNPSRYPQYGGLKVDQTQKSLNVRFRTWEEIIDCLIKQLSA